MTNPKVRFILSACLWLLVLSTACHHRTGPGSETRQEFDLLIVNGRIIDGTGSPWYAGDIGIRNGRVAAIGVLSGAKAGKLIDAKGLVVAPGFIDMLGQSEESILIDPRLPSKIYQGITTEITGEGGSAAPLNDKIAAADKQFWDKYGITADWRTFRQYFDRIEKHGMGINLASYVGATQVRKMILGDADQTPSPVELEDMKRLVREAMQDGAIGLSTSLQYAPAPYAKTDELIALASEAGKFGGIYATHMRSEGAGIFEALDEAIKIGRDAHIPVEIWHLKAAGKPTWGKMPEVIKRIEAARSQGIDVAADTYAYPAWFNSMSAIVPPWAHDGGVEKMIERLKDPVTRAKVIKDIETPTTDWDNEWQEIPGAEAILVAVVRNPALAPLQGRTIAAISKERKTSPLDTVLDILIEDGGHTSVAVFGMSEPDITAALIQPWVSVDNDSRGTAVDGPVSSEYPHPRAFGTFPRIIRKYVREEKLLRLEEAIRKFSSLAAQRMRLNDRGVLKQGMWADIVVFDPDKLRDLATFEKPNQLSEGMQFVLVNGVPVIDEGKMTGKLPGKVIRGHGYKP